MMKEYKFKHIIDIEKLARFMHNTYEDIAVKKGWKTQKKCRVDFDKLPKENKEVMLEIARQVANWFNETETNIG